MITLDDIKHLVKDLPPSEVERAVKFNKMAKDEAIISFKLFIEQNKLPRQIFLRGYDAMFASAALFLAKKYNIKLDETMGSTHKNMRKVLSFYTKDTKQHERLIDLYEKAIEKFQALNEQYRNGEHFADRVVDDLINEGFYQGKKINYYGEANPQRKDPLELIIDDAKSFISDVVEPFLFIMENLTDD